MVLVPSISRTRPVGFYDRKEYTPDTIGSWVATRDLPWNTIGKALEGSAGTGSQVDHLMTAEEALHLAGLDYDVRKVAVKDEETGKVIPRLFATFTDDPATELGRYYFAGVSDKYEAVRPSRTLAFFDEVIGRANGSHYSAVWDMKEKSQMGITIQFPETIVIDPNGSADEVGLFGLGWNSFDGSTGLGFGAAAARWFCMNQYNPSIKIKGGMVRRGVSHKHTKNVTSAMTVARAREAIGIAQTWGIEFDKVANSMFAKKCSDVQLQNMLKKLAPFSIDSSDGDTVKARKAERTEELMTAWRAEHNANITGTMWGAFNVISEWASWGRNVNGSPITGTSPIRQRAIGEMVNPTVQGYKNTAWELATA